MNKFIFNYAYVAQGLETLELVNNYDYQMDN
jgi:hypothetical protein